MPKRRPHARRDRVLYESSRPGPVDLTAVAFEAERVVPIRPNFTAILESGFPLLTRGAEGPEAPKRPLRSDPGATLVGIIFRKWRRAFATASPTARRPPEKAGAPATALRP